MNSISYVHFSGQPVEKFPSMEELRDRLIRLMRERNLSNRKLALMSHVSPEYVGKILRGEAKSIGPGVVKKIADVFDVPPEYLHYGTQSKGHDHGVRVFSQIDSESSLPEDERRLLYEWRELEERDKSIINGMMQRLIESQSPRLSHRRHFSSPSTSPSNNGGAGRKRRML